MATCWGGASASIRDFRGFNPGVLPLGRSAKTIDTNPSDLLDPQHRLPGVGVDLGVGRQRPLSARVAPPEAGVRRCYPPALGVGVGGWVCVRIGVMRAMFLGALLMLITNLAFALLAAGGPDYGLLATVVFFDNLTGGMATTAFVAYLSGLCNVAFTATQYALLASLGNFARIQLGSVSGWAVDVMGGDWASFFVAVAAVSLPAIGLLGLLARRMRGAGSA